MVSLKVNLCSICKRNDILTAHQLHDGQYYYLCFDCLSNLFEEILTTLDKECRLKVSEIVERKANG